jgi:F-type H+-transporting ATPase subunit b
MQQPMLLLAAKGGEHPLIDIDLTIVIQLAIFIALSLLATKWLFKPYLKMRDDREQGIEGAREEADKLSSEADARLADYDAKLASARDRARKEQHEIRAEASAHQRELMEKTRSDATAAMDDARGKLATETESARAELLPKADSIANDMVAKLLGREVA